MCLIAFNNTLKRPRSLPCGHTFCSQCINELNEQGKVTCPTCRRMYEVPEAGHFPVNYVLESVVERRRREKETIRGPSLQGTRSSRRFGMFIVIVTGFSLIILLHYFDGRKTLPWSAHWKSEEDRVVGATVEEFRKEATEHITVPRLRSLLQEQEDKVLGAISGCQEVLLQLDQYYTTLAGWHDQQQQLEDKLQAIIDDSRSARMIVQQEEFRVATMKAEVQQEKQQLHAVLESLRKVTTEHEALSVVSDVVRSTYEAEQRVDECCEMFPDDITARTVSVLPICPLPMSSRAGITTESNT